MANPARRVSGVFHDPAVRRSVLWMILAALGARLVVAPFAWRNLTDPGVDHFPFGWEMGHIGRSIASGRGFSSPFQGDTGPTAMLPPLYAYVVGGVFRVFGIFTAASAIVLLTLQSIFSAVTCIPVYAIGVWTFGKRAARGAGWTWAFFPYAIYLSAAMIWSTSLSALLLALILWLVLRIQEGAGWRDWLLLGFAVGTTALTNPTIIPVCVALVLWLWLRAPERRGAIAARASVAVLIALLCIVPWTVRNYRVFGRFIPIRSNLWAHLYGGNSLDTGQFWHADRDPTTDARELAEAARLGEMAYMAEKKQQALAFVREHPRVYVWLVLKRIAYFWTGIFNLSPQFIRENPGETADIPFCTALSVIAFIGLLRLYRHDPEKAWPPILCLAVYPVLYYLTTYEISYHHPIDPVLIVLAAGGMVRGVTTFSD
jgi:4-amino-4-deoxy-L-arabinose transferase-like glycosyltransferase